MSINVSMGVYCPKCNCSIGVYVNNHANCPQCNGEMIPVPKEKQTRTFANFHCECGYRVGLMVVAGLVAKCPGCKKEI